MVQQYNNNELYIRSRSVSFVIQSSEEEYLYLHIYRHIYLYIFITGDTYHIHCER